MREGEPPGFHARYMLADRGGYRLDQGLDEVCGVEQSVGFLDDQEWNRIWEGYGDANPFPCRRVYRKPDRDTPASRAARASASFPSPYSRT